MSRSPHSFEWTRGQLIRFRVVVVVSALLQWLLLVGVSELWSQRLVVGLAGASLLLVVAVLAWSGSTLSGGVAMPLTTGSVGGLGMLVGMLLDQYVAGSSVPVCPMHAVASGGSWLSGLWMNAMMFLTCVPACMWLCPACSTRGAGLRLHALCAASMWAGMLVGGKLLFIGALARVLGNLGALHLAMLLGMVAGVALVLGLRSLASPTRLRA